MDALGALSELSVGALSRSSLSGLLSSGLRSGLSIGSLSDPLWALGLSLRALFQGCRASGRLAESCPKGIDR